jgi:hypothetical protein
MFKHLKYYSYFIIILNIQINLFYFQIEKRNRMEEIHENVQYKLLGITIKVQLPELIDPSWNEIKMIVRKPRY